MVEVRASAMPDRPSSSCHYRVLTLLDTLFSATLAAPAVVGYWRGTWCLSDVYICPGQLFLSPAVSAVIGLCGLFLFSVFQHVFDELLHPDKHRLLYYFSSRLYTAVFGFCCVSAWRGTWQVLDYYSSEMKEKVLYYTTIGSILLLMITRTLRNVSAPPFAIALDICAGYFAVPTMCKVNNKNRLLYIFDCVLSVAFVGTCVVFAWRGVWGLFDLYLYPTNLENSALGSLTLGYIVVTVTFILQPLVRYACARLQGLLRLLLVDMFQLVAFLGTVNVWRGIWTLLDLWLFPENKKLSCWTTHFCCFIFLVLLKCSNSILVRGVYKDAKEDNGKCVSFSLHYLRFFFKVEREEKAARRRNLLLLSHAEGNEKDAEKLLTSHNLATIIPKNPKSTESLA